MNPVSSVAALRKSYADGQARPQEVIREAKRRALESHDSVWIQILDDDSLSRHIEHLAHLDFAQAPLWGVPFAIKDNIDLAGIPTTAGCPAYAYKPSESSFVVQRLLDAGAIPLGKTNLDQFATGLTGTRSPYGVVPNPINSDYIAGGSSSGSAVAVQTDTVPFALGTDTAGSGRIPAAFNGIVGFKPTRGWWSTGGVVPACRTLDCVSVFSRHIEDARLVAEVAGSFDRTEPYSKRVEQTTFNQIKPRFGFLSPDELPWFGDDGYRERYRHSLAGFPEPCREIDPQPFLRAGELLYEGPWLAERVEAVGSFIEKHPVEIHPITLEVIGRGTNRSAQECFRAQYELASLRRCVELVFEDIDILITPTTPTHFTRAAVEHDPITTNALLGTFSHCVNLLDLCAVAVPVESPGDQLPFGITMLSLPGRDFALLHAAASIDGGGASPAEFDSRMNIAVCGAHMTGQPLNDELVQRGGYLVTSTRTTPKYRLFALPDGVRPALMPSRVDGAGIEVEVWSLPRTQIGGFLATVAAPLAIGSVDLEDGRTVHGFVGDARASEGATDITLHGGWRSYRQSLA